MSTELEVALYVAVWVMIAWLLFGGRRRLKEEPEAEAGPRLRVEAGPRYEESVLDSEFDCPTRVVSMSENELPTYAELPAVTDEELRRR
mgnify:CR=1 FL=1